MAGGRSSWALRLASQLAPRSAGAIWLRLRTAARAPGRAPARGLCRSVGTIARGSGARAVFRQYYLCYLPRGFPRLICVVTRAMEGGQDGRRRHLGTYLQQRERPGLNRMRTLNFALAGRQLPRRNAAACATPGADVKRLVGWTERGLSVAALLQNLFEQHHCRLQMLLLARAVNVGSGHMIRER